VTQRPQCRRCSTSCPAWMVLGSSEDGCIHCELSSPLFRFVNNVEFLLNTDESVIHFRSASRVGHYDFGLNRR